MELKQSYKFDNVSQNKELFKSETGLAIENFEIMYEYLNPGGRLNLYSDIQ